MPIDTSAVIEMAPVVTGDMGDIPPDLPEGEWDGTIEVVKAGPNSKGNAMLTLKFTPLQAYGDTDSEAVGRSTVDWYVFYPANHEQSKNSKRKIKALCEAAKIDLPDTSSLEEGNFSSLVPFAEALEANQIHFFTSVQKDKNSGEAQTRIHFSKPGKKLEAAPVEDEEDEKPAKKAAPSKAPPSKGANGHSKKSAASARR